VDMTMLVIFYSTIRKIITYVSKDHKINYCLVWFFVHLVALTYIIEVFWSDLFTWGSHFMIEDFYVKFVDNRASISFILFSICTLNSILVTWIQGHVIIGIFNYFGAKKFN